MARRPERDSSPDILGESPPAGRRIPTSSARAGSRLHAPHGPEVKSERRGKEHPRMEGEMRATTKTEGAGISAVHCCSLLPCSTFSSGMQFIGSHTRRARRSSGHTPPPPSWSCPPLPHINNRRCRRRRQLNHSRCQRYHREWRQVRHVCPPRRH